MYAVVFTYSFEQDCFVYLFHTEQAAKDFLKENFDEEVRIEVEENERQPHFYLAEDGWYGEITDNEDTIYYHIAKVYE